MSDNGYYVNRTEQKAPPVQSSAPAYILYFPISSSPRPSRYFRNSSLVTRSVMLAASFDVFNTPSSTKMGQSTRSASASASEGRESMLMTSPPRSSQITA